MLGNSQQEELDPDKKLLELMKKYEEKVAKKPERTTGDKVMDWMQAAGHIANAFNTNRGYDPVEITDFTGTRNKQREEDRKRELTDLNNMQNMYQKYKNMKRQSAQDKLGQDRFDWQKTRAEIQDDLAAKKYEESKSKQELSNQLLQKQLEQYGQMTPYQQAQLELANKMTPYQQEQLNLQKSKLENEGKLSEYQKAQIELAEKKLTSEKDKTKKTKLQEEREKNIADRYDSLQEQMPNKMANIEEAESLIKLIEKDELDTGPGSKLAGDVGSFFDTEESTYKQRLDALAEKAARAQLKANGEVRPTDADVEGMKRAMFNMGNTEAANVKKLRDYIKQEKAAIDEYKQMKKKLEKGEGLEDFILENTYKKEGSKKEESKGPYGNTVERNGKKYIWNPSANKYQLM